MIIKKLIHTVLVLILLCTSKLSNGQNTIQIDTIKGNNVDLKEIETTSSSIDSLGISDKIIIFENALNQLSKINFENYKKSKFLIDQLNKSGVDLKKAKNSFFIGASIQSLGLLSSYVITKNNPDNIKPSNRVLIISTSFSLGFLIDSWVRIGKSGKRLSELN